MFSVNFYCWPRSHPFIFIGPIINDEVLLLYHKNKIIIISPSLLIENLLLFSVRVFFVDLGVFLVSVLVVLGVITLIVGVLVLSVKLLGLRHVSEVCGERRVHGVCTLGDFLGTLGVAGTISLLSSNPTGTFLLLSGTPVPSMVGVSLPRISKTFKSTSVSLASFPPPEPVCFALSNLVWKKEKYTHISRYNLKTGRVQEEFHGFK